MITADKRNAVFLLHQEGVAKRAIARQLRLSRNAVRQIIAQSGQLPLPLRPARLVLDPDLLRQPTLRHSLEHRFVTQLTGRELPCGYANTL